MTINIAIVVSEGLVMAADSFSRMTSKESLETDSVHQCVEKITEIRGRPMAVMVHGIGEIGKRTIISLIREFELIQYNKSKADIRTWSVDALASHLFGFIAKRYDEAYPPLAASKNTARPTLGIIVGGYSPQQPSPEIVEISFPDYVYHRRFGEGETEFAEFWGHTPAAERIFYGVDRAKFSELVAFLEGAKRLREDPTSADSEKAQALLPLLREYPDAPQGLLEFLAHKTTARHLKMDHRLRGMPLQEAVDFGDYLGSVCIGYDRFCRGWPSVGGDLDVVAIQPDGLHWYRRKPFLKEMAAARERALDADDRERLRSGMSELLTAVSLRKGTEQSQDAGDGD